MKYIKKSINNNNIILPKESIFENPIDYLRDILPKNNNKKFSEYLEELFVDISGFTDGIQLLGKQIINRQKIGIIGDYDVDGTIGTSILVLYFQWLNNLEYFNFEYIYHIPNRFREGYGPSIFAMELFSQQNVNLIITVDSGTTACKEVEIANNLNMKTLILDHHLIQNEIPNATCFINCQNSKNFKNLSGAGLAFVFLIHLHKYLKKIYLFMPNFDFNIFSDLVALSTVCDFVSFSGLNKTLVEFGLKKFNWQYNNSSFSLNKAIHIILQYSMYYYNNRTHIRASDLGFAIGPYLNVAGRMCDGNLVVKFLTNNKQEELEDIFFSLQSLWQDRRKIQEEILLNLEKNFTNEGKFILLYDSNIHEGIMGIIAAQFKEKYNKPTIVIAFNENIGKASIRSVEGFNAGEFISLAIENKILIKGGGHSMAGGFVMQKENINSLKNLLTLYTKNHREKQKNITISLVVQINSLDREFYDAIHNLGPFGIDYEEPIFLFPSLIIRSIYVIGDKHLSIRFSHIQEKFFIKGMWFFIRPELMSKIQINTIINIIGNLKMINGKIEIYIIDAIIDS
jgi:single-stranded-DNA-specific exonuclease